MRVASTGPIPSSASSSFALARLRMTGPELRVGEFRTEDRADPPLRDGG